MDRYILSNEFDELMKSYGDFSIWRTKHGDYVLVTFKGLCVYKLLYKHDSFHVVLAALCSALNGESLKGGF